MLTLIWAIGNEISTKEQHSKINCGDTATGPWGIKESGLLQVRLPDIKRYGPVLAPAKDTGQLEAPTANRNSYTQALDYLWVFNSYAFLTDSGFWKKLRTDLLWAVHSHRKLFGEPFNLSGNLETGQQRRYKGKALTQHQTKPFSFELTFISSLKMTLS